MSIGTRRSSFLLAEERSAKTAVRSNPGQPDAAAGSPAWPRAHAFRQQSKDQSCWWESDAVVDISLPAPEALAAHQDPDQESRRDRGRAARDVARKGFPLAFRPLQSSLRVQNAQSCSWHVRVSISIPGQ